MTDGAGRQIECACDSNKARTEWIAHISKASSEAFYTQVTHMSECCDAYMNLGIMVVWHMNESWYNSAVMYLYLFPYV